MQITSRPFTRGDWLFEHIAGSCSLLALMLHLMQLANKALQQVAVLVAQTVLIFLGDHLANPSLQQLTAAFQRFPLTQ